MTKLHKRTRPTTKTPKSAQQQFHQLKLPVFSRRSVITWLFWATVNSSTYCVPFCVGSGHNVWNNLEILEIWRCP